MLAALAVPLHLALVTPSIPVEMVATELVLRQQEQAAEERPDHLDPEVTAETTQPLRTLAAAAAAAPTAEHQAATVQALLVVQEVASVAGLAEMGLAAVAAQVAPTRSGRRHQTVPRLDRAAAAAVAPDMMAVALVARVGLAVHMAAVAAAAVSG